MTADHPPSAGWRPHPRYPDPAIEILDARFAPYRIISAAVERLYTGCRWAEGPVWFGDGRYLLWSDIPNNRILRWEEETGAVSVFRKPSNFANGNTRDRQGRLVTCEHGRAGDAHRVRRHDHRAARPLRRASASTRRTTWSSSPTARSGSPTRRSACSATTRAPGPKPSCRRRSTGSTATAARRASSPTTARPERALLLARRAPLYVVESRGIPHRKILAYDVTADGRGSPNKRVLIDAGPAARPTACAATSTATCGAAGAWAARQLDGVHVFAPDGKLIGRIALPERCANVCFGGAEAQPPVHGGQPVALRALRQYPGRPGRVGAEFGAPPPAAASAISRRASRPVGVHAAAAIQLGTLDPRNLKIGGGANSCYHKILVVSTIGSAIDHARARGFISYSRSDSLAAEALRAHLTTVGISTFLDRYALPAGQPWQPQLEQAIARCNSMAVLLGPSGIGTWQQREIQLGLDRQAACEKTNRPFPVLPVLLQGLENRDAPLGRFLGLNTWVDLRSGLDDPEALQRLIAGVQGQAIDTVAGDPRLAGLCPYRGLLPFREEDAGLFFGRRRYIDELVQKVRQRSPANLVAVVGRSGSGKSSIVYAGLLPALRKEKGIGNDAVWDMVALRPGQRTAARPDRHVRPAARRR